MLHREGKHEEDGRRRGDAEGAGGAERGGKRRWEEARVKERVQWR